MKKRILNAMLVMVLAAGMVYGIYYGGDFSGNVTDTDIAYDYDNMDEEEISEDAVTPEIIVVSGNDESFDEGTQEEALIDEEDVIDIRACLGERPSCFDPTRVSDVSESSYMQHIYEGLMKYRSTSDEDAAVSSAQVVFGMARSYKVSEDGLTYNFYLRDDIYWSDGQPVTAEDFVYSWRRLVNPETGASHGDALNGIVLNASSIQAGETKPEKLGIKAVNDKRVKITLEAECPYFLRLLAAAYLVPLRSDNEEAYLADGTSKAAELITNGAYRVDTASDEAVTLVQNENYYNVSFLGPEKITFAFDDNADATDKFVAGDYDFITRPAGDSEETVKESDEYVLTDSADSNFLIINLSTVTDWRIRAAICLALNRENLVEDIWGDHAKALYSLVPSGITDSQKNLFEAGYDIPAMDGGFTEAWGYTDYETTTYKDKLTLAQALTEKAVADGGFRRSTTLKYIYNKNTTNKAVAAEIEKQLEKKLELDIEVEGLSTSDYVKALAKHDFDIARFNWTAEVDDATAYLDIFESDSTYNYGNFYQYEFEYYRREAAKLNSGEERDAYLRASEAAMFSQAGFGVVPLYSIMEDCALASDVENVYTNIFGEYFFMFAHSR